MGDKVLIDPETGECVGFAESEASAGDAVVSAAMSEDLLPVLRGIIDGLRYDAKLPAGSGIADGAKRGDVWCKGYVQGRRSALLDAADSLERRWAPRFRVICNGCGARAMRPRPTGEPCECGCLDWNSIEGGE